MIEEIILSRTGLPIASVHGNPIHSLYDPIKEAERFVASKNISKDYSCVLLIAPGLCYLVPPLRASIPGVRIIALQCSSFYQNHFEHIQESETLAKCKPDSQWSIHDRIDLYTFLGNEIDDYEARTTKILEWRPSTKAYGTSALVLLDSVAGYLKRVNANAITSEKFGKKWIRNAIRFIHAYNCNNQILKKVSKPIVLIASGPSLMEFLPCFSDYTIRNQFILMALSSAVDCLLERDIIPDIAVATDGGNWAKFHLFEAVRRKIPLAISITGALPSQYFELPLFAISDGTHWQQTLMNHIATPVLIAPQRGTVAATAIDLALTLTNAEIYIAGLDLGVRDGHSHARPNALDRFYNKAGNRFHPATTGDYQRYLDNKQAPALDIYAKWFSTKSKTYGKRLIVLGKPNPALAEFCSTEKLPFIRTRYPFGSQVILPEIPFESSLPHFRTTDDRNSNCIILLRTIQDECTMAILDTTKIREGVCGELLPLIDADLYRHLLFRCRMRWMAGEELIKRILESVGKQLIPPTKQVLDQEANHG